MTFKKIAANDTQELLRLWRDGSDVSIEEYEDEISGAGLEANELADAVSRIQHSYRNLDKGLTAKNLTPEELAAFDGEAAIELHRAIFSMPPSVEGNPGFWRWTALRLFEVIEWRHPRPDGAHPRNYGLGSRMDNYPRRLWLRAELSYVKGADDPYALTRRGSIDFWESGIIRRRYASCHSLVRAFVRYQYPEPIGEPRLVPGEEGARSLYKRLSRLHATMALELLDDEEAYSLLSDIGSGLRRA